MAKRYRRPAILRGSTLPTVEQLGIGRPDARERETSVPGDILNVLVLQPGPPRLATAGWGYVDAAAALLVILAAAALLAVVAAAIRKPGGWASLLRRQPPDDSSSEQAADELRLLIAEAREMADQFAAAFDARTAELEQRIADLESRIARLDMAEQASASRHRPFSPPGFTEAKPVGTAMGRAPAGVPDHDADPMAGEIYRLADQGLPPVEIARRLGQHTGKVELILALRRA